MDVRPEFANFTPKGVRVLWLIAEGMGFDEALAIADSEYTSDGLSLRPGAVAPARAEVHA